MISGRILRCRKRCAEDLAIFNEVLAAPFSDRAATVIALSAAYRFLMCFRLVLDEQLHIRLLNLSLALMALNRKALWADGNGYAEIWLEKDALSGVVYPITAQFDVPVFLYHLGDFDPSGVNAGEKIEETLREMAPEAEIHFERLAVNLEQISASRLPTRPTKTTDSRSKNFGNTSVELDAIEPDQLRTLVREAIEQHLPPDQFKVRKVAEASERRLIRDLVGAIKGAQ
jgi:hypothetical protein